MTEEEGSPEPATTPWHFKLLIAALVLYLGMRAVQAVVWLLTRF